MIRVICLFSFSFLLLSSSCSQTQTVKQEKKENASISEDNRFKTVVLSPVEMTEKDWQNILTNEEFRILRDKGTERAFTGKYWDNKTDGVYHCSGCQLPLFTSETKFKSGTGWPSFYQPARTDFVEEESDKAFGWNRVEVLCAQCGGHLGHIFEDGPAPTGLRYCINGNVLDFVEEGEKKD